VLKAEVGVCAMGNTPIDFVDSGSVGTAKTGVVASKTGVVASRTGAKDPGTGVIGTGALILC
jgi:hypothetical protein